MALDLVYGPDFWCRSRMVLGPSLVENSRKSTPSRTSRTPDSTLKSLKKIAFHEELHSDHSLGFPMPDGERPCGLAKRQGRSGLRRGPTGTTTQDTAGPNVMSKGPFGS